MNHQEFYEEILARAFGYPLSLERFQPVGGGCIHNTVKLVTNKGHFFLKWNADGPKDIFEKEARGLNLLKSRAVITVPQTLAKGQHKEGGFLLMEFIDSALRVADYWEDFGHKLADLHRTYGSEFGLDHNNYIGRLPQDNNRHEDWHDFLITRRFMPQLELARKKGLASRPLMDDFDRLYKRLPDLLPQEASSLLHGDLWSGNVMIDNEGKACLIDPAVYYGHREIELAFTMLFGGFDRSFYQAYCEAYPTLSGFDERVDLYNIYPLLVHLNLFGESYLSRVIRSVKKYI